MTTPQERFAELASELAGETDVALPSDGRRRFGSTALKVGGSIFAMLVSDQLAVKLPAERVTALVADGTGGPFASSRGTPMREWVVVLEDETTTWSTLAREALAHVRRLSS